MRILILSNDAYLRRKIEIELSEIAEISNLDCKEDFDAIIYDTDSGIENFAASGKIIKLSRNNDPLSYKIPLPIGMLERIIRGGDTARLIVDRAGRAAVLDGKNIKLTAHEFDLLSLLLSGGSDYTSRETISEKVFGGAQDGLINIYIHYLRSKLEISGEKIIIASRKLGYKINENFLGGKLC